MMIVTSEFSIALGTSEEERKDKQEKRKEDTTQITLSSLSCSVARCTFMELNKASLTNQMRKEHNSMAQIKFTCPYSQGLNMQKRFF